MTSWPPWLNNLSAPGAEAALRELRAGGGYMESHAQRLAAPGGGGRRGQALTLEYFARALTRQLVRPEDDGVFSTAHSLDGATKDKTHLVCQLVRR